MTSTAWAAPWASARMSSASLIVSPPKPSSSRSVPPITVRDSVAGRSGRRSVPAPRRGPTSRAGRRPRSPPGTGRARAPRGRRRSRARHRARGACPGPAAPSPGKCLTVAATPADWRPRTIAAPCRPTAAGSSPNERMPERRVARFGREVEDRGVDDVDAHRPRLAPDRRARPARSAPRRRPRRGPCCRRTGSPRRRAR